MLPAGRAPRFCIALYECVRACVRLCGYVCVRACVRAAEPSSMQVRMFQLAGSHTEPIAVVGFADAANKLDLARAPPVGADAEGRTRTRLVGVQVCGRPRLRVGRAHAHVRALPSGPDHDMRWSGACARTG